MSEDNSSDSSVDCLKFVTIVKDYPTILDKSMTSECRRNKSIAYLQIVARFQKELGVKMTVEKISKRIQNMKVRMKKKLEHPDVRNGVRLKDWEKLFLKFVEFERTRDKNTGAAIEAVRVPKTEPEADIEPDEILDQGMEVSLDVDYSFESEDSFISPSQSPSQALPGLQDPHHGLPGLPDPHHGLPDTHHVLPGLPDPHLGLPGQPDPHHGLPRLQDLPATTGFGTIQSVFTLEGEETRMLNNHQLQRLVLLEQLRYYRKAQELVHLQTKRELQLTRERTLH